MRSLMVVLTAALAVACSAVQAQAFRWVDKDGKVRYGDVPPPGVEAKSLRAAPKAPTPPAKAAENAGAGKSDATKGATAKEGAAKAVRKGPLTPTEQEQAFRERQLKAKEETDKANKEAAEAERLRQNCASAQEGIRSMERGGRMTTITAQGESKFLDDAERAARLERLREAASTACK